MEMVKTRQRPRGWWYPFIFVGGFLVVFAVNGTMAFFAVTTFTGLIDKRPFDRGATYNDRIALERAQEAMGWTLTMDSQGHPPVIDSATGAEVHPVDFTFTMVDAQGQPVDGLVVVAEVQRPVNASYDHSITLDPMGQGRYGVRVDFPLVGQWELLVVAEGGNVPFQQKERVFLR